MTVETIEKKFGRRFFYSSKQKAKKESNSGPKTDALPKIDTVKEPITEPLKNPDTEKLELVKPIKSSQGFFLEAGIVSEKLTALQKELEEKKEKKSQEQREEMIENGINTIKAITLKLVTMTNELKDLDTVIGTQFDMMHAVIRTVHHQAQTKGIKEIVKPDTMTETINTITDKWTTTLGNTMAQLLLTALIPVPLTPLDKQRMISDYIKAYTFEEQGGQLVALVNIAEAVSLSLLTVLSDIKNKANTLLKNLPKENKTAAAIPGENTATLMA